MWQWLCEIIKLSVIWDALTAVATTGGAIFVVLQLGSLRKQINLQNYSDYTKRYQEIVLNFPENVNSPDFKLSSLNKGSRDKTMRYMRAYFDLCFEEWDLNNRRLIDKNSWKVWEGGTKTALSKTAFKQAWKVIRESGTKYGDGFDSFARAYVERIQ